MLTLGALATIVAGAFGALAVATVMPRTVDDLGGLHYYGWAFSAYLLANIVGLTVAGAESDRSGPGRPYLAGILCFSAGLLIAGLAPATTRVHVSSERCTRAYELIVPANAAPAAARTTCRCFSANCSR